MVPGTRPIQLRSRRSLVVINTNSQPKRIHQHHIQSKLAMSSPCSSKHNHARLLNNHAVSIESQPPASNTHIITCYLHQHPSQAGHKDACMHTQRKHEAAATPLGRCMQVVDTSLTHFGNSFHIRVGQGNGMGPALPPLVRNSSTSWLASLQQGVLSLGRGRDRGVLLQRHQAHGQPHQARPAGHVVPKVADEGLLLLGGCRAW